jgi:hypothetical protein
MIDKSRLDGLLFAIMGDATLVERWWFSPNHAFDSERPIDVFVLEPERVRNYVLVMANIDSVPY